VQLGFEQINARLSAPRDPMGDDVVRHMVAGYALVDTLVGDVVDLFAMGNLKYLLELNTTVLCGASPAEREGYTDHLQRTEERFYDDRQGGVRDLVEWYERHRRGPVVARAVGVYIRMLSKPQLFIEGNHRTGALTMSYLLAREGHPPFVLTVENAPAYFEPSTVIRTIGKHGIAGLVRLPRLRSRLTSMLADHADPRYLLPPAPTVPV